MSTFYGGPQLFSITSIDELVSTSKTFYTVPSGYYAVVEFLHVDITTVDDSGFASAKSIFIDSSLGNITVSTWEAAKTMINPTGYRKISLPDSSVQCSKPVALHLNAGDAIKSSYSGATDIKIKALIYTYKKP